MRHKRTKNKRTRKRGGASRIRINNNIKNSIKYLNTNYSYPNKTLSLTQNNIDTWERTLPRVNELIKQRIRNGQEYIDFFNSLTQKQKNALNEPNSDINAILLGIQPDDMDQDKIQKNLEYIREMDTVFNSPNFPRLQNSLITFRCYSRFNLDQYQISQQSIVQAYTSSSVIRKYSENWCRSGGLMTSIFIPIGSTGIMPLLFNPELTNKLYQYEILLDRKGKLYFLKENDASIYYQGLPVLVFLHGDYLKEFDARVERRETDPLPKVIRDQLNTMKDVNNL